MTAILITIEISCIIIQLKLINRKDLRLRKASKELDHQYKKEQKKYVKNKVAQPNNVHANKKSKVVW